MAINRSVWLCSILWLTIGPPVAAIVAQEDAEAMEESPEADEAMEEIPDLTVPATSEEYDELFKRFLAAARADVPEPRHSVDVSWISDLALDVKARRVNDIVTVQVIESISGSGAADSALAKSGTNFASLSNFFGVESNLPSSIDPASLVDSLMETDFEGGGATNRSGALTAIVTTRVAEVLPNGDLVLEGVREVEINGDRQVLLLSGIVRPEDIGPNNVVFSPAVGQLRIKYYGEGLIKDSLKPGFITRILNKIF